MDDTKLRLVDLEGLQGKLDKLNVKAVRLEIEVDKLKLKVIETKEIGIIEIKKSNNYKLALNITKA